MAFNAVSMSQLVEIISGTLIVPSASYALFAEGIAGLIESASYAIFADTARSSSYSATSSYFSGNVVSSSYALSSSYAVSSSYSLNTLSSSYALSSSYSIKPTVIAFACSDETTQIVSGSALGTFYIPYSLTVSNIKASLTISGSSSSSVDILKNGTTVFAAPMIISASAYTGSRIPTLSSFNSDDRIQVDLNAAGTDAAGLKIYILGN